MRFKTRPGKKRRTVYLPKERKGKKKTTKINKKRKSMKSYQAQYSSLERQLARNPRNLAAAIRLIAKEQKLSREMKEFKEMRTAEIQRQLEELENKDRSRRRGANKNKWSEADLKKYLKLKEELSQLTGFVSSTVKFDDDAATEYAAIKKYYDYVDRGIIKEHSVFDKYDAREYLEKILTREELLNVLKEAETKREKLYADSRKRAEKIANHDFGYSF